MPLSIQIESVAKWHEEARPTLIDDHWKELGLDLDLKGEINVDALVKMEAAGMASVITVRKDEWLVGYLLAIHHQHLHYNSSPPMFIVDMYYIAPKYRHGAGVRLFKFMQDYARKIGCIKLYLSCKVHQDHSELFKKMGFKLSDYAFVKRI